MNAITKTIRSEKNTDRSMKHANAKGQRISVDSVRSAGYTASLCLVQYSGETLNATGRT